MWPGTDCWNRCSSSGGKCDFCGAEGYCCSATKLAINGDCPNDIVEQLTFEFAAGGGHQCIAPINSKHFTGIFLPKKLSFAKNINFYYTIILDQNHTTVIYH